VRPAVARPGFRAGPGKRQDGAGLHAAPWLVRRGSTLARVGGGRAAYPCGSTGHMRSAERRPARRPQRRPRRGEAQPADAPECMKLAELCHLKRLDRAAAAFYAAAFATDTKLADDLDQWHHSNAACYAALAAAGQGEDAPHLPDKARRTLRRQALA